MLEERANDAGDDNVGTVTRAGSGSEEEEGVLGEPKSRAGVGGKSVYPEEDHASGCPSQGAGQGQKCPREALTAPSPKR